MERFQDIIGRLHAAVDDVFSLPALYLPPLVGAQAVPVTVEPSQSDETAAFGRATIAAAAGIFRMQAGVYPDPVKGGRLMVGAQMWLIQGDPTLDDDDRMLWTMRCVPEVPS